MYKLSAFNICCSIHDEIQSSIDDHESSDDECDFIADPSKKTKKKAGRKAKWSNSLVDDMVDIVVNNDYYKKRLIFVNVKNQKNSEIYEKILKELKDRAISRGEDVPFTTKQLRTKFKKAIAECKKAALTIKTASGIKRFQDDKGYGSWFDQLFSLVKTRDSCQPEQAIEPSSVQLKAGTTVNPFLEESEREDESGKNLFVPVKNVSRKRKKEDAQKEMLEVMKKALEKDPMKEYIQFAREEAERSRQHEARMMEMMCSQTPSTVYQQMQSPLSYGVQFQTNMPQPVNDDSYSLFKL